MKSGGVLVVRAEHEFRQFLDIGGAGHFGAGGDAVSALRLFMKRQKPGNHLLGNDPAELGIPEFGRIDRHREGRKEIDLRPG